MSDAPASSRDLDAAVAERVMGWTLGESAPDRVSGKTYSLWFSADKSGTYYQPDEWSHEQGADYLRETGNLWAPSVLIEQAWQVVDEMRRRGWYMVLENHPGDRYSADFVTIHDGVTEWGDSAPECIVRAALAATKEEPPDDQA